MTCNPSVELCTCSAKIILQCRSNLASGWCPIPEDSIGYNSIHLIQREGLFYLTSETERGQLKLNVCLNKAERYQIGGPNSTEHKVTVRDGRSITLCFNPNDAGWSVFLDMIKRVLKAFKKYEEPVQAAQVGCAAARSNATPQSDEGAARKVDGTSYVDIDTTRRRLDDTRLASNSSSDDDTYVCSDDIYVVPRSTECEEITLTNLAITTDPVSQQQNESRTEIQAETMGKKDSVPVGDQIPEALKRAQTLPMSRRTTHKRWSAAPITVDKNYPNNGRHIRVGDGVFAWSCPNDTYRNEAAQMRCAMCEVKRDDAWKCDGCSTVLCIDIKRCTRCRLWLCTACHCQNEFVASTCLACEGRPVVEGKE